MCVMFPSASLYILYCSSACHRLVTHPQREWLAEIYPHHAILWIQHRPDAFYGCPKRLHLLGLAHLLLNKVTIHKLFIVDTDRYQQCIINCSIHVCIHNHTQQASWRQSHTNTRSHSAAVRKLKPRVHTELQLAKKQNQSTCYYPPTLATSTIIGPKFHLCEMQNINRVTQRSEQTASIRTHTAYTHTAQFQCYIYVVVVVWCVIVLYPCMYIKWIELHCTNNIIIKNKLFFLIIFYF